MPIDRTYGGYRIFVGDLGSRVGKYELEKEFEKYGPLIDVWVARNPPGFAFLVYKYEDDSEKAVKSLDGRTVCGRRVRVEHARPQPSRRGPPLRQYPRWDPSMRCYNCGERGHFARDCERYRRQRSRSRSRSRSRRSYTRSRSKSRSRSRSKSQSRSRSRSRSRSPPRQKYARRSSNKSRDEKASRSGSRSNKESPAAAISKKPHSRSGSEKRSYSRSRSRSVSVHKQSNDTRNRDGSKD